MPYRLSRLIATAANPLPATISVTALGEFATCPLRYWFLHIERWRSDHAFGRRDFGTLVHEVLAQLFRLPPPRRTRVALAELTYRTAQRVENGPPTHVLSRSLQPRTEALWQLLDPSRVSVAVEGVERRLSRSVSGVTIRGRADLVFHVQQATVIADFKTGDAPRQVPTGELYPDVRSRSAQGLPVVSVASDDLFFALRTYAVLLDDGSGYGGGLGLEMLYLSPPHRVSRTPSAEEHRAHESLMIDLVEQLVTSCGTGVWQARHGGHCFKCPVRPACPLHRGGDTALPDGYADILRRSGLHRGPGASSAAPGT